MSISVAVIQRKDRINRDNTAPLFIRVTIDKKRHLEAVGVSIPLSAWDKNASRIHEKYLEGRSIQLKIDARVEEIWRKIKRLEALDKEVTIDTIFGAKGKHHDETLQSYFCQLIERKRQQGKIGTAEKYKYCLKILASYTDVNIKFDAVNTVFLERFKTYLQEKGNTPNSIATKFSVLRAVYNQAVVEEIISPVKNPFLGIKTPWKSTRKRAITKEEVKLIESLSIPSDPNPFSLSFARDIFLFSYYSAGVIFSDIATLKYGDIENGCIFYKRHKTGKDIMCPLNVHNESILKKYLDDRASKEDYIFPILGRTKHKTSQQRFNRIHKVLQETNRNLSVLAKMAGIKHLTTYVARHTYATVMKRAGVGIGIISETMGHSDIKTTQIYLGSFEEAQIKEAMDNL